MTVLWFFSSLLPFYLQRVPGGLPRWVKWDLCCSPKEARLDHLSDQMELCLAEVTGWKQTPPSGHQAVFQRGRKRWPHFFGGGLV